MNGAIEIFVGETCRFEFVVVIVGGAQKFRIILRQFIKQFVFLCQRYGLKLCRRSIVQHRRSAKRTKSHHREIGVVANR